MGKVLTGPASKGGGSEYSDIEKLNSLSWKPSLPEDGTTLSFIGGLDSTEGGFFSLEEVSEVEYSFGISNNGIDNVKNAMSMPMNLGKRRRGGADVYFKSDVEEIKYFQNGGKKPDIPKERKLKKKRIVEQCKVDSELTAELTADDDDDDGSEGEVGGFHAWDPLRLHPSLMKSIRRLGFKEPTAIQKACIPVASHQGKDMAGAAETGSGKTLAFGVPILQRLLEEGGGAACGHLRALIITPTRELALQVTDHIKEAARETGLRVVPIVGGMSAQKQERLLRGEPPIVIATPGRLWELMSEGKSFLTRLDYLSFFVLDEADRMIENGHFSELQSIIDMLPTPALQKKRRQTFVFSATIALSSDFRKKLKYRSTGPKAGGFSSIEALSARAGMRPDAAVVDLTSTSILASKLEESFIECREDDKDAYLYYILCVHGHGRKIVFCTSIAALRRISSLLRILGVCIWTLHAQMQQRARLKAIDRFRGNENGILVATDVAARGIDIPGVRAVVHYQLPHSADVYVHRSGRTARASSDGCSIALISSNDRSKFASLCRSLSKEDSRRFPLDGSYMPEVLRRLCVAQKIDRMSSKNLRVKAKEKWIERNAKMADLVLEREESDEERTEKARSEKGSMLQIEKLEKELRSLLSHPLRPKSMSRRFVTGSGVSPVIQKQFMELVGQRRRGVDAVEHVGKLVVIGHDCTEPLEALRNDARSIVHFGTKNVRGNAKHVENRRKKKAEKKRLKDMRRKEKKCRESERSYY